MISFNALFHSNKASGGSTEPITWTSRTSGYGTYGIIDVCYDGSSYWLTAGESQNYSYSTTPTSTWTMKTVTATYNDCYACGYGDGNYVVTGDYTSQPPFLGYATDITGSLTYRSDVGTSGVAPWSIQYGNSLWVYNTGETVLYTATSLDGTFTARTANLTGGIRMAKYLNSLWVACGHSETGVSTGISTSTDGITWTARTTGLNDAYLMDVAYGGGYWIAVGYDTDDAPIALISSNGTDWSNLSTGFAGSRIYSVAYGNGAWVIAGGESYLYTSTDGITWTSRTSNFGGYDIRRVAYGNHVWVAVGAHGKLSTAVPGV